MTTAAIICELNPFHKGHACLIEHARRAGADRVILLMSGDYVQRGEPSVIDRHARAHMALLAGADLVLSLPTRFATASAETFASSAVRILDLMGCVDVLVFGSESGEIGPIIECASILAEEPDFYREQLRSGLRRGLSFPKARAEALPAFRELLREPNQILGVEYCKALIRQRSSIRPLTVRRIGGSHDAAVKEAADGRMAPESYLSAAAIRTALHRGVSPAMLAGAVPEPCLDVFDRAVREGGIAEPDDFLLLLLSSVWAAEDVEELLPYADVTRGLAGTILKKRSGFTSWKSAVSMCASSSITSSHISRALLHIALGIRAGGGDDVLTRVLGVRGSASDLLSEIRTSRCPVIISPASDSGRLCRTDGLRRLFDEETALTNLYEAVRAAKIGREAVHSFSVPPVRIE